MKLVAKSDRRNREKKKTSRLANAEEVGIYWRRIYWEAITDHNDDGSWLNRAESQHKVSEIQAPPFISLCRPVVGAAQHLYLTLHLNGTCAEEVQGWPTYGSPDVHVQLAMLV
uniref:Uncharacterized protein n=1 Tax=Sphaerodactylus townsendi TaxID=933632 RepID=A0ACB8F778_9SAUR